MGNLKYKKGYWKGSHYITQGRKGYWSKYGRSTNEIESSTPREWICQSCAVPQFSILPQFLLSLEDDTWERVKVCTLCAWRSKVWNRPLFYELIEVIRIPSILTFEVETLLTLPRKLQT